ncbi:MAG: YdbL family protein [Alphaproteobacteria bacterium]|nr:YdbL family protein [Alphaproteobacteria bacterium]MBU1514097.1 YdbL family protein [Alphaproteobacteria bacterium]MBU2096254.1 YdbL family protein [Alphaproteobacteria bacterium]MBU2151208.1 YdbL family protein [Alphaproteobacteria bacterium]MBU2307133.1 YdbL family protein [Alphaproteobacteria bacterium]
MNKTDFFNVGAAVMLALAVTPAAAMAMDSKAAVDAAKAQGVVGEQADGFLGFVKPSSDPAIKAAVDDINAGRAALYREAAAKNGVTAAAAGASAYTTVVQSRIKAGEFFKPAGGSWTQK